MLVLPLSSVFRYQVDFETLTRAGNFSHVLYRSGPDSQVVDQVITLAYNLSCYHRVTVFDIESDNSTSELGRAGEIQLNGSRPCTAAPVDTPGQEC